MQLFYNSQLEANATQLVFSTEESRHLVKVLRKKEGDRVQITNGKGYLFDGHITNLDSRSCNVTINTVSQAPKKQYALHLAVAPTKMNDRYEWFLEKATEIGVDEITPILCERSERKVLKLERMNRILQSAMKQSLQTFLPKLNPITPLDEFVQKTQEGQQFIAHCEDSTRIPLQDSLKPKANYTILIGPEGDFSPTEIEFAINQGYQPVQLGNTRLRTETAAIVACAQAAIRNV